jgi:thiosulfate dehydrogenase
MRATIMTMALLVAAAAGVAAFAAGPKSSHKLPAAKSGGTVVGLCDGETSLEVRALKPGEALSHAEAQQASDRLMAEWRKKHPEARWDQAVAQNARPSGDVGHGAGTTRSNTPPPSGAPGSATAAQTGVYSDYTNRDDMVWRAETDKFAQEGNRVFHDAKQLGGTIGVSCDMCHPNAANTHPETYPKFQVQLGRVALLRDMINWCIENPVKGRPMADDDDRLRAMEAYIYAQRKGVKLDYGRH